ncbi:MAG TPA: L,D-transpeptidase family protein [Gaiellaceae bacterium]|nr:L,D-transpeptidase family protein [Gaiellaceae bacterium]
MGRLALLLSVVFACAVVAPALADTPPTTITTTTTTTTVVATVPDGVVLGGVAIGGLDADAATAAVVQRFSRPVVLRVGRSTFSVSPASLGVKIWADTAVAKALTVPPDTSLGLRAGVGRARVAAYVARLARRLNHDPSSSRLLLRNFRPLVTPSRPGLRIEVGATARLLEDELAHGTRVPVRVPAKLLAPQATATTIGSVIVIRRSSNLLTLYNGAHYVRQFHVATGQSIYPTPLGRFQIVVKWTNPTWYPPTQDAWAKGLKPVPPGPNNPLGTRWMGINSPGVGIHGTDEPASIGYSESHGCVRMFVPDAEWLFNHVAVGTPVFIVAS